MDRAFQWKATYSVKVEAMDDQHKRLFEIIRELYSAMCSGRGKEVVGDVLGGLLEYTVKHFAEEEKLMEENGYELLAMHRAEHKALTDKVRTFKKDFDAGSAILTLALMTFLQDWLTDHIQVVDQKYGDFLNAHGVQ